MPKALKGCTNPECKACKDKRHFRNADEFCSLCREPLHYVCSRCWMQLEDGSRRHCVRCENELKDKRDRLGETVVGAIASGAKAAGQFAAETGQRAVKAAGNAAAEIKDSAERIVDQAKTDKEARTLNLPPEYKKQKGKIPDMGFPTKQKELYGTRNGQFNAIIIKCLVEEDVSLPFEDITPVIDEWHQHMPENGGLIEAKTCLTGKNRPMAYFIMKHHLYHDGHPMGSEYSLNANIKSEDRIFFINASFSEMGVTGQRDSIVFQLTYNERSEAGDPFDGWTFDPFDPEFKDGCLMNQSEKEEYDSLFPNHPLTKAREFVRYLIENN